MKRVIAFAIAAWIGACSSGESSPGTGGAAGSAGSGGGGGAGGCPSECFAASECVSACGETPVNYGCCGCPPGTIDVHQCQGDAGCHPPIPDAGSISCGSDTCNANQVCVFHCCGGAPTDASACKPAPPSCVDASSISCAPCDGDATCSAPTESCTGSLVGQTLNCVCA